MRAEIRERLAEKIPLAPPKPKTQEQLNTLLDSIDSGTKASAEPDKRLWLKLTGDGGEAIMLVPENVACNWKARYGKAPGFQKWFLERMRDLMNAS